MHYGAAKIDHYPQIEKQAPMEPMRLTSSGLAPTLVRGQKLHFTSASGRSVPFGIACRGEDCFECNFIAQFRTQFRTQAALERALRREGLWFEDPLGPAMRGPLTGENDEEQRRDWTSSGAFFLHVGDRKYRIKRGRSGNVELVDPRTNEPLERYCAHPIQQVPDEDTALAQMMMLKYDERAFIGLANVHWTKQGFPTQKRLAA